MTIRSIAISIVVLSLAAIGAAADPRTDDTYRRIVGEIVIPGYRDLTLGARAHQAAWKTYCAAPSAEGRDGLVATFHDVADRWAAIELFRSGPASEDFRRDRFFFWPGRKNAVERRLARVIEAAAEQKMTGELIREESAAVQGLPALERLIFGDAAPHVELGVGEDGRRLCEVGEAISVNAANLADDMYKAWESRTDLPSDEAKTALATDLVTAYSIIKDVKIETVIGESAEDVKPRAAEFWLSGRTMRNIILNLQSLDRTNAILRQTLPADASLPAATLSARGIAESAQPDLAATAAGKNRSEAIFLLDAVDAAGDRAIAEVPAALGVTVGFNSLDGD